MKPRFCVSSVGVSDAVDSAWRNYLMLYEKPRQTDKLALKGYVHRLVVTGARNQHQLIGEAFLNLKRREERGRQARTEAGFRRA